MTKVELMTARAWSLLDKPYRWGGDDSLQGFDCSGLIVELMKTVGLMARKKDRNANGLWTLLREVRVPVPHEGCLVFYRASEDVSSRIVHVEYCIDDLHSIGASGGDRRTTNAEVAAKQNAYIKIRPIHSRVNIAGYSDLGIYDPKKPTRTRIA